MSRLLQAIVLTAALAFGATLLAPDRPLSLWFAGGWLLIALGLAATHRKLPSATTSRWLTWLCLTVALAAAVSFRATHWRTVPAGYGYEVLNFVKFASSLVRRGFPYEPYGWYAHTLLSYVIGAVNAFVADEMLAMRLAAAGISVATVLAVAWCAWQLFEGAAAWATASLLAISWWHLWATRNGYHQFLMPLLQPLVVGGMVAGLRNGSSLGFGLAALGLVLGLHAYWGLYVMPLYAALLALLVRWKLPEVWAQRVRAIRWFTWGTAVGLIPLGCFFATGPQAFQYIVESLDPQRVGASSTVAKLSVNLNYLRQALLPGVPLEQTGHAVLDPVTWAATAVGLVLALRTCRSELGAMAVLLLLFLYIPALALSIANEFYIGALLCPLYLLAGLGLGRAIAAWWSCHAAAGLLAIAAYWALWAQAYEQNQQHFLQVISRTMLRSADRVEAQGFILLERLQAHRGKNLFVPRNEPGRDFGGEAFSLAVLPGYSWLNAVGVLTSQTALFPAVALREGHDAVSYVPRAPFAERFLLPTWRRLYRDVAIREVAPPPPWPSLGVSSIGWEIEIPWEALRARFGMVEQGGAARGHLWIPADSGYEFRSFVPVAAALRLHGKDVGNGRIVYLEEGYHPIELPLLAVGWTGWQIRRAGGTWEPLDRFLVHAPREEEEGLRPYEASLGAVAEGFWEQNGSVDTAESVSGLIWEETHGLWAVTARELVSLQAGPGPRGPGFALPYPHDFRPVRNSSSLELIDSSGRWLQFLPARLERFVESPGSLRAALRDGQRLVLVSEHGAVRFSSGEQRRLLAADGSPLHHVASALVHGGRLWVIDSGLGQLLGYDLDGKLQTYRVLPRSWWESELAADRSGNLYVLCWRDGWRAYNSAGDLLFHPDKPVPMLFSTEGMLVGNLGWGSPVFSEGSAALASGTRVAFYEWHPARP